MTEQFKGKVALITGGGAGIGRATALAFSKAGAKVVIGDVMREDGEETAALIRQSGGDAFFANSDISKSAEVESLMNTAASRYGRLDFACNNAGIEGETVLLADSSEENWDKTMDINLKGVWLCLKYEIRQMLQQGGGAIVNIASTMGLVAHKGIVPYVASKHGVIGLTKAAALDYADANIRINAVCPGVTRTKLVERTTTEFPEVMERLNAATPMGRICQPEEIANAVIWLCSDAASFITGHSLTVDGGFTVQ